MKQLLLLVLLQILLVSGVQEKPKKAAALSRVPEMTLAHELTISVNKEINEGCSRFYAQGFRKNLEEVVSEINKDVKRKSLCSGSGLRASVGDMNSITTGNTVRIRFTVWLHQLNTAVEKGAVMRCGNDIQSFVQDLNHWPQPIVSGSAICPPAVLLNNKIDEAIK